VEAATAPVIYEKAPTQVLGRRFLAIIIDGIIVSAILTPTFFVWGRVEEVGGTYTVELTRTPWLLASIIIPVAYWWLQEGAFGATIGKFVAGIRVYKADGSPAGWGETLVRNLIRIYWIYGICLIIGWIVALAQGPSRQRTLDLATGTIVSLKQ
jgi:uncharacterized RDD family membrane protein YckC